MSKRRILGHWKFRGNELEMVFFFKKKNWKWRAVREIGRDEQIVMRIVDSDQPRCEIVWPHFGSARRKSGQNGPIAEGEPPGHV